MKLAKKIMLIVSSFCLFIISLFCSLTVLTNNPKFFQKIWQEEGIYEEMNISEEELTKVIVHTMDYMWGKEDDLQIEVTLEDGTTREFYVDWDFVYEGKEWDELGHMADCKKLFLAGKSLMIISCILLVFNLAGLIYFRKYLTSKDLNTMYFTYAGIVAFIGILGVFAAIDFDTFFTIFHKIFFSDSIYSWMYPANSFMIMMLPEDALFANILYKTLINFGLIFGSIIAITIFIQHKLKTNQNKKVLHS